ncbi:MAG: nickel superoxide dismutase [Lysobacterales bacterium]|jgi:nickel superoxide dismutase
MNRIILVAVFLVLGFSSNVLAHCEIPCGIYTDQLRTDLIAEHAKTIRKSMNKIEELSKDGDENYNQLIRWVDNKETHAKEVQEIFYHYFMTQRIKPVDSKDKDAYAKYMTEITLLHKMLRTAMKTKQTTDEANVDTLEELLESFKMSYFGEDKAEHTHK